MSTFRDSFLVALLLNKKRMEDKKVINVFQPTLGKEELDAVEKVFESNWIGKGKKYLNLKSSLQSI